jgi:glycosyltransferase involved in cell wall biosynthesis
MDQPAAAPLVDVILPVLDERDAIPGVLASLPPGYRPIVVDNGSSDGSGPLAASLAALVVEEPRRGFGAACYAGLTVATADVVCFMDCDGSLDGASLPTVTAPVVAHRADLVLGARQPTTGAWPRHLRGANRYLAWRAARTIGVRLRDLGPMRAARREPLLALGLRDRRFGWPLEMVLLAAQAGWRIEEVIVPYHPRIGRSKVTGTLRGTLQTVRDMRAVLA